MAAIGIGNHDLLGIREGTAIGVAQRHLHLVAPPFLHLEFGAARRGRGAGPHLLTIEQYLGTLAQIAAPEVPVHLHIGGILYLDQIVVGSSRLIDFNDGKLGGAPSDGRLAGRRSISGRGAAQTDREGQHGRLWT